MELCKSYLEKKPTEEITEENCENIAPLLKFLSGCESVNNIDMDDIKRR
jgi:hypothetical protein